MDTPAHADLIHHSLEQALAQVEDLVPQVYARYFALHPEAQALFGRDDDNALKGAMLSKLVQHILDVAEGRANPDLMVSWASDHVAYGVGLHMFPTLLACVRDALREAAGGHWTPAVEQAWQAQFERLLHWVDEAYRRFAPTLNTSEHLQHARPGQGRHPVGD